MANDTYILVQHLHVLNANAMSSSCTIGFPAMTAWLGAMHALQRKLNRSEGLEAVKFTGVAVVCHRFDLQTYKEKNRQQSMIIGTKNPLKRKGGEFVSASFIELPRVHLDVSLVLETSGVNPLNQDKCLFIAYHSLNCMKMAGGDITSIQAVDIRYSNKGDSQRELLNCLMPGYALIERRDLLKGRQEETHKDSLDCLLDFCGIFYDPVIDENGEFLGWNKGHRLSSGWIVPIAVGFKGISPLGHVANQRDDAVLHRFSESMLTLGEFKMPYRFVDIKELMWRYVYDEDCQAYMCVNQEIDEGGISNG